MRILFLHHFPLQRSAVGRLVEQWMLALEAAGHETRALVLDQQPDAHPASKLRTVVCRVDDPAADLPFDVPSFSSELAAGESLSFLTLGDEQLAAYRDQIRRQLDAEIDRFDPDVIHAQHVWVQGQLALETGVPYLLSAWGPELVEYKKDARYRMLADQAAENAGRILTANQALLEEVASTFEGLAGRVWAMGAELKLDSPVVTPPMQAAASHQLVASYEAVLKERFG